jgi:hypothetical protein
MRPFSLPFQRVRRYNQLAAGRIDQCRCAQPLSDRGGPARILSMMAVRASRIATKSSVCI